MDTVDEYINQYAGEKKEWLNTFVSHMRQNFPELRETISYQMPTFKYEKGYIAFSVAKDHFSFHTLDFEMIEALKTRLPRAKFGKGCAKVPYDNREAMPVLFEMARTIVERSKAARGTGQGRSSQA